MSTADASNCQDLYKGVHLIKTPFIKISLVIHIKKKHQFELRFVRVSSNVDINMRESTIKKSIEKIYPQSIAAFAVWIITAEIGVMCVWSSPYLAQLTSPNSPLPLTLTEASWVASLLYLGRLIGAVLGSISVTILGSKKTCLITAIPTALGWILTIAADSPIWLYAARVSLGVGFGFAYSCFALYLGEVAAPEIRGSLVSFAVMGGPVGNFLASVTGSNMTLRTSSLTYFVPCIVLVIILSLIPDSPHHLVKVGNFEAARTSIKWYHGDEKVEEELEEVTKFVKATSAASFMEKLAEFRLPHIRRATFLVMMLFAFMQLSGLNNVLFYMEIILKRGKSNIIPPSSAVSYLLSCSVITAILCVGLYDKCGRRILMIISSMGVSIALVSLGTHFILLEANIEWAGSQWFPVASLFTFIIFFVMGLGSIPSIVSSEVYSANVKSVATCIANLTAAGAAFFASKAYQPLVDLFGEAYVFYGHAIITFMAVPYAIYFMPETKGKSLQQIQDDLIRK